MSDTNTQSDLLVKMEAMQSQISTLQKKDEEDSKNLGMLKVLMNPAATPEELRKAIGEASNLRVRESLSSTLEKVANDTTPFLDLLLKNTKVIEDTRHHWVADFDDATDDSFGPIDEDLTTASNDDLTRSEYSADVRFYRRINKVGIVEQGKVTPDGRPILEVNRMHHLKVIAKQLNRHAYEGNSVVTPNQLDGTLKFQDDNGSPELTLNLNGGSVTVEAIEEILAKMAEIGGGRPTHMLVGGQDSIDLQLLLQRRNVADGYDLSGSKRVYDRYPSTQSAADPLIVTDFQPDTLRKKRATAENVSGALQFTGAIAVANTIDIGGVTYTASATPVKDNNEFLAGTATVAIASLIGAVNDGFPVTGNVDTTRAVPVTGVDGANFYAKSGGDEGNALTIANLTGNMAINEANFTGGTNSTILFYNMPMIQLAQFKWNQTAGIGTFPVFDITLTGEKELITWLGCLEINNPYSLAKIENVGSLVV